MTLGLRIKNSRLNISMNQSQLAKRVGITQQSLQAIENDEVKQPRKIEEIANVLSVSPAWLQFGFNETLEIQDDNFGSRLRLRREAVGLSQGKIAKLLGITQPSYQRWELGVSETSLSRIKQLADILETSPEWLAFGAGDIKKDMVTEQLLLVNQALSKVITLLTT